MMSITQNIQRLQREVCEHNARLVVVAKYRSIEEIQTAIDAGATDLAFNRVQEAEEKFFQLRFTGRRHLIGHLQKNKVKKAVQLFDIIQSVDSLALAQKIDQEAEKSEKIMSVLLQVNVAEDPDKFGFAAETLWEDREKLLECANIELMGLMTIGRLGESEEETRKTFQELKLLQKKLQPIFGRGFTELSMGMSGDYSLALEEGATMVRVGSGVFQRTESD